MKIMKTEVNKLKSISAELKDYIPSYPDGRYINITEFENGEGWTIDLDGKIFNIHYTELDLINYLTKTMDYYHD